MKTIAKAAVADDPERQNFDAVLTAWSDAIGEGKSAATTVAKLVGDANRRDGANISYVNEELRNALIAVAANRSGEINTDRLGKWLRSHRDSRF